MIVTCASCLTKFNLEDSKISPRGAKVRCSRCEHVFYIPPPAARKEEIVEDFESFARAHEELIEPGQKRAAAVPRPAPEEEPGAVSAEEMSLFADEAPAKPAKRVRQRPPREEEKPSVRTLKAEKVVRKTRKGPSMVFALIAVLLLMVLGAFYLWTELESGGTLSKYVQSPMQKVSQLWGQIWGTEKEGLIVGDLNQYEETIENIPLLVIEGKVTNQSGVAKRHVKVRVVIFDQNKAKIGEKETFCGRALSRDELRRLPPDLFKGEINILPKTEGDKAVSTGGSVPFAVVFKDLGGQAKEFGVEIVEAPKL